MYVFFLLLMVITVGLSAYASARRAGAWSWPLFTKTVLGVLFIGLAAGFFGVWLRRLMGADHAAPATLFVVLVIATGLVALAFWTRPK